MLSPTSHSPVSVLSCILALYLCTGCAGPLIERSTTKMDFEPLRRQVVLESEAVTLPSVSIAIASCDNIIFAESWGHADKERGTLATPDTAYAVASVSKPITATALMTLVQQALIDLDSPIDHYLGDQKLTVHIGNASEVTVRRVAQHTSGLPLHHNFFYADEDVQRPGMEESIRRYGHIVAAPGESFQYSNFGYGLLEYIIERESGMNYADFLRKRIFGPLGMTHSTAGYPVELNGTIAVAYGPDGDALPIYDFDHRGASAVFASARDLARFGIQFLLPQETDKVRILHPNSRAEMVKVYPIPHRDGQSSYGLGTNVRVAEGELIYSHSGTMPGVSSTLTMLPEHRLVVVVLINSSAGGVLGAMGRLRDLAIRTYLENTNARQVDHRADATEPEHSLKTGNWRGKITTHAGDFQLSLKIDGEGAISVALDDTGFHPAEFRGEANGFYSLLVRTIQIPTPEAIRYQHGLLLRVKQRNNLLNGSATAFGDPKAARQRSALSYWVELNRTQ